MFRSVISAAADKARIRPTWLEREGDRDVVVQGYSPLDNLIYGAVAAAVILVPAIYLLVTAP